MQVFKLRQRIQIESKQSFMNKNKLMEIINNYNMYKEKIYHTQSKGLNRALCNINVRMFSKEYKKEFKLCFIKIKQE